MITCTVKQLAFVAWQRRRNPMALADNSDLDLDPSCPSGIEFDTWWDSHKLVSIDPPVGGFPSIRIACWEAWLAAPSQPTRDNSESFAAWWQRDVIAAQPIESPYPPKTPACVETWKEITATACPHGYTWACPSATPQKSERQHE
jgi:hypothetical protein